MWCLRMTNPSATFFLAELLVATLENMNLKMPAATVKLGNFKLQ